MAILAKTGGTPQNAEPHAGEVVLTRAEAAFLSLCLAALDDDPLSSSPLPSSEQVDIARGEASLSRPQAEFIKIWIQYKGDLISIAEHAEMEPGRVARYLSSPAVIRILTEAAKVDPNIPPPIATKEELAVAWTLVSRIDSMPISYQREARQELAKMMGYYPQGSDGVNVGVQVILNGELTDG